MSLCLDSSAWSMLLFVIITSSKLIKPTRLRSKLKKFVKCVALFQCRVRHRLEIEVGGWLGGYMSSLNNTLSSVCSLYVLSGWWKYQGGGSHATCGWVKTALGGTEHRHDICPQFWALKHLRKKKCKLWQKRICEKIA